MCCNKHLTLVEREMILKFRAIGCSITEIAQRLGRNKATVSRELQRNSINGEYIPAVAEEIYHDYSGVPRAIIPDLEGHRSGVSRPV